MFWLIWSSNAICIASNCDMPKQEKHPSEINVWAGVAGMV